MEQVHYRLTDSGLVRGDGNPLSSCQGDSSPSAINPNFAVEFKERDKIMMQNTEKPLLKRQKSLSEKKHKKK